MQMSIATADIVNMTAGNSMNTAAATLVLKKVMAANQPLEESERNDQYHYRSHFNLLVIRKNCSLVPRSYQAALKLLKTKRTMEKTARIQCGSGRYFPGSGLRALRDSRSTDLGKRRFIPKVLLVVQRSCV